MVSNKESKGDESEEKGSKVESDNKAKTKVVTDVVKEKVVACLLYTSPSPRDRQKSRMPSSA